MNENETFKDLRKNVLAKCYRKVINLKKKLLDKQKRRKFTKNLIMHTCHNSSSSSSPSSSFSSSPPFSKLAIFLFPLY